MNNTMVDVTLHIDEQLDVLTRESLRDSLLHARGVMAADCTAAQPHLMIVEYDPDVINAREFLAIAKARGLHAELVGL